METTTMKTPEEIWAEVAKSYNVHPETLEATAQDLKFKPPSLANTPVEEVREWTRKYHLHINGEEVPFAGTEEEVDIDGVPATVYVPASRPAENPSIMVYFHGGSLMVGSRVTHERSLKTLAEMSGVVVVNVEYRLLPCPEDPMVPFKDAVTATLWVTENRVGLGGAGGMGSKVGLGGDSAGGQIVLGVINEIKSGLDFLVLVYPTADFNTEWPSCKEFENTPGFNTVALRWRLSTTNGPIPDADTNPTLNSSVRADVSSLPPSVIVLSQIDPMRDSGKALGERLKVAGVLVRQHVINGVPHGFFSLPGVYKETTHQAFLHIADFLKKFHS